MDNGRTHQKVSPLKATASARGATKAPVANGHIFLFTYSLSLCYNKDIRKGSEQWTGKCGNRNSGKTRKIKTLCLKIACLRWLVRKEKKMWEQFEGVELTEEEVEQLMWEYNVVTR